MAQIANDGVKRLKKHCDTLSFRGDKDLGYKKMWMNGTECRIIDIIYSSIP